MSTISFRAGCIEISLSFWNEKIRNVVVVCLQFGAVAVTRPVDASITHETFSLLFLFFCEMIVFKQF